MSLAQDNIIWAAEQGKYDLVNATRAASQKHLRASKHDQYINILII